MGVRVGSVVIAIGVIHQAFGLVMGRPIIAEILHDGGFNAIGEDMPRNAIFWFLMTGLFMILLGWLAAHVEARGVVLPAAFGWMLLAISLLGGAFIPASGFWLALLPAGMTLLRARRIATSSESATVAPQVEFSRNQNNDHRP